MEYNGLELICHKNTNQVILNGAIVDSIHPITENRTMTTA
jgi:hypothetical protein